jgi:hypothetical protein
MAQLALVGLCMHVHSSLVTIAQNGDYAAQEQILSSQDKVILTNLHDAFKEAYSACQPQVDLTASRTSDQRRHDGLLVHCLSPDEDAQWFATFIATRCAIHEQDVAPSRAFVQCASGANWTTTSDTEGNQSISNMPQKTMAMMMTTTAQLSEEAVFCACESQLLAWVDAQR